MQPMPMYALGMIETVGYPSLIAAADAAAKAANVKVAAIHGADAGIVTVYLTGDVSSVQAAVRMGEAEARKVGHCRGAHVIARPDPSLYGILPQMADGRTQTNEPTESPNNSPTQSRRGRR